MVIQWRVVPTTDAKCFDGVGSEIAVGSVSTGISPNVSFQTRPPAGTSSGWAAGTYYLCAMIEPYDNTAETSEIDNDVRSEGIVTVSL